MGPISTLIDQTEKLLGHSPHPPIVAVPIGAWTVSCLCDGLGLATGNETYDDAARVSMAIGLVGAAGAALTGIRDYGFIPPERPSHEVATRHGLGNAVVGSLFAASYMMRVRDHAAGRRTGAGARLLALLGGGLTLYTAWLGGVLVEEMGEAVKPVMDRESSEDEPHGRERLSSEAPLGLHDPSSTAPYQG